MFYLLNVITKLQKLSAGDDGIEFTCGWKSEQKLLKSFYVRNLKPSGVVVADLVSPDFRFALSLRCAPSANPTRAYGPSQIARVIRH